MNTSSKDKSHKPSKTHPWKMSNPYSRKPDSEKLYTSYIFEGAFSSNLRNPISKRGRFA